MTTESPASNPVPPSGLVTSDRREPSSLGAVLDTGVGTPADPADKGESLLRGVFGSAAMLAMVVGVGQLFGIARELFIANQVGASAGLDAVLIALVAPTMVGGLLASGTSTALLPAYRDLESRAGVPGARGLVGAILTWTVIASLVAMIVIVVTAQWAVSIAGPGLGPTGRTLATSYVPILAPIIVLTPLSSVLSAVCQIQGRFRAISLAWFVGPIASLVVTMAFWSSFGLAAVALGVTGNAAATCAVFLLISVTSGYVPAPRFTMARDDAAGFIRHAMPLTVSSAMLQLNLLADRSIASTLPAGGVSAIRYGEALVRSPMNAISPAWTTAVYPSLVKANQPGSRTTVGTEAGLALRYVLAIFVPLTVIGACLSPLAVDALYRRGAFDADAVQKTTLVVAAFAPLVTVAMAKTVLASAHNSYRNGRLLLLTGLLNAVLNAALDFVLAPIIGPAGISLSTSLTTVVTALVMARQLSKKDPGFDGSRLLRFAVRVVIAAAIVSAPCFLIAARIAGSNGLALELTVLVALATAALAAYVALASRLGIPEPLVIFSWIGRSTRARLRQKR